MNATVKSTDNFTTCFDKRVEDMVAWAEDKKSVVFTNGCFDILHSGHVSFLAEAATYGEHLIVAVNSDSSVQCLKGKERPYISQDSRMYVLSGLQSVSAVVLMNYLRCTALLSALKPSVWVKGGDYTLETLDQTEVTAAQGAGTRIVLIPFAHMISTSQVAEKIKAS